MAGKLLAAALTLALTASAQRTQSVWGQCGGQDYTGPTACPTGNVCTYGNPWYSQCIPASSNSSSSNSLVPDSPIITASSATVITVSVGDTRTVITTYVTYLTTAPPVTAQPTPVRTSQRGQIIITAGGTVYTLQPDPPLTPKAKRAQAAQMALTANAPTPTILQTNQYWIRAVAAPNYHKYLQTSPANTPGPAILGSSRTAGQYNVVNGQLVSFAGPGESPLYLHVEKPADFTQRALATWFNTTKNEFGKFAFSGDALTWEAPEVKRQNLAAWLVCKGQQLFINTGAYAYQTPSGCADQTIHYYNGATAND